MSAQERSMTRHLLVRTVVPPRLMLNQVRRNPRENRYPWRTGKDEEGSFSPVAEIQRRKKSEWVFRVAP
jgi:hypothetical protein